MSTVVICDLSQIKDPKYSHNMKYRAVRKIHALCKMAEAPTDLLNYVYEIHAVNCLLEMKLEIML